MTIARGLFERRSSIENPNRPLTDASLVEALGGGMPGEAGVPVTPTTALTLLAVYRAVALQAGLMGSMPLNAYRRTGSSRAPVVSRIIDNPHPDKTPFEIWEYIGQSLLLHGNAYAYKLRDGLGRVVQLEPLHPGLVFPDRKKVWVTEANPSGKRFLYTDPETGSMKTYTPYDVMHVPGLSYDGISGLSPIGVAREAIGVGLAARKFGARMFGRGALIQGVLQSEQDLDETKAKRLKAQWRAKVSGPDAWWDIPVLDNKAQFKAIGLPPSDAQFIETQKFSVVEISRLYGMPPHLLGDVERSTSWGTGIEQQNLQMLTYTIDPFLVRTEQRAGRELVLDSSVYVKFNRGALLRADTATRFMAHYRAITGGWENADEIRTHEDQDPLPDGLGQIFYRPNNIVPVTTGGGNGSQDGSADAATA